MTFDGFLRNAWILNHRLSLHLHLSLIYIVSVSGTSASGLFTEIQLETRCFSTRMHSWRAASIRGLCPTCTARRGSRDYFQLAYTKFLELRCVLETCVPGATPFPQPFMLQTAHAGVPVSCPLSPVSSWLSADLVTTTFT